MRVTARRACKLTLIDLGSSGKSTVLFPTMTFNSGATLDLSGYDNNGSTFVLGQNAGYPQTLVAGRTNGAGTDIYGSLKLGGNDSATLKLAGAGVPGTLTLSSNFVPASGTITYDLGTNATAGSGTNDLIVVGGNLDLSQGTAIVAINAFKGAVLTNTPYTLMSYAGSLIGSASGLSVSSPSRAYLPGVVTVSSGLVRVTFNPSGQTNGNLVWQGNYGQNWDLDVTANWLNGLSSDYFFGGDNVLFNDGASQFAVNLVGALSPGTTTVSNNINDYTLSSTSSGSIGSGSLTKQGTGKLTITSLNNFAGGTAISAGTVSAGNSALGSGPITLGDTNTGANTASLLLNNGATLANAITVSSSATGSVIIGYDTGANCTVNGLITLQRNVTLTDASATLGSLLIQGGIAGAGDVTVTGGGAHKWQTVPCNFSGNIFVTGAGTLLDINTVLSPNVNVNLESGTVFGDVNSPSINNLTGSGLVEPGPGAAYTATLYVGCGNGSATFAGSFTTNSGGYSCNLVKNGTGTFTLTGDSSTASGNTTVSNGTLVVANATGYGLSTGTITVNSNAALVLNNPGGYGSGNGLILVSAGGSLSGTGSIYSATNSLQVGGVFSVGNPGDTSGKSFTVTNAGIIFNAGGELRVDLFSGAGAGDNTGNAAAADVLLARSTTVNLNAGAILNIGNPNSLTGWAIGDKWQIINWNAVPTGAFTSLSLPMLGGALAWDLSNLYTTGVIAIQARPSLTAIYSGGAPTLTWPGSATLQAASEVSGVYTNISGAASPYVITNFSEPQKYFRLLVQ